MQILSDGSWSVFVRGSKVEEKNCPLLQGIPSAVSVDTVSNPFSTSRNACVCPGNTSFNQLCRSRFHHSPAVFYSKDDTKIAVEEITPSGAHSTVRHVECQVLINNLARCKVCNDYRPNLIKMQHRVKNKPEQPSPYTHHDYLSKPDLHQKLKTEIARNKH